ncbi:MAG: sialate O-acetylesterase [Verrucomicrobiota bacterium]
MKLSLSYVATFLAIPIIGFAEIPEGPVKIFILAGQSNMEGHGKVEMGLNPEYDENDKSSKREIKGGLAGLRHLATSPGTSKKYGHFLGEDGEWIERDDVWVLTTTSGKKSGRLSVGFGKGSWFGPELQFGHRVGDLVDEPVLLVKTAWGGHSLGINFRPPSSGKPNYEKQRFNEEDLGASYREMVKIVKETRANLGAHFPELEGRETEIIGFGWHQGWNDAGSAEMVGEYAENMKNLIRDLRKDLDAPELPVVIANTGMIGMTGKGGLREQLCEIQLKLGDAEANPEFAGSITSVETRPFKRSKEESPSGFGYHWNHNAESHFLVGDAMGQAMVELLK